jgi:putative transcriptional regulator
MIDQILQKIDLLLKNANFETFLLDNFTFKKNKFCFDLLVKKDDLVFSLKVFPNIDNISSEIINDIKSLSLILKSKPLLIGIKNRYQKLEENTIYIREELPFISFKTLQNILSQNQYPYILAKRGGGIVFLNGQLLKQLREKHRITRKELSEKLEITKRTVCAYENESMHPSENLANKIKLVFEDDELFKKINIFDWKLKIENLKLDDIEESELNDFETHIQDIINEIGINTYWYKKGSIPFKLSIFSRSESSEKEDFYPLFSGISEQPNKFKEINFKCLEMFNNLFHKTALFIIDNNIKIPTTFLKSKIPFLKIKNLEQIDDEEEFIGLVQESQK